MRASLSILVALVAAGPACAAGPARSQPAAQKPAAAKISEMHVFPPQVSLRSRRGSHQLVVTGTLGGRQCDLTRLAEYRVDNRKVAAADRGRVTAAGDGKATVTVRYGDLEEKVLVRVSNCTQPDPVQFELEVLPVLTKQGCASGSCHGSPHGKGGFSLSLFGYDPRIDRVSLTRDGYNRRINVLDPDESLILKKPLLRVPHVGGKRLLKTDAAYQVLRNWVYEGANVEPARDAGASLRVTPGDERVLRAPFLTQQLSVEFLFSDHSGRYVTDIATYESSNSAVATVDARGLITGRARGQAAISVRYRDRLVSVPITVIQDQPGFAWNNPPESNFIDRLVHAKQRQLQYLPSGTCSDETFVRRVHLDLTGLLPTPEQVRKFLAECEEERKSGSGVPPGTSNPPTLQSSTPPPALRTRARLIDELLDTEEYARFWALKKADLMRVSPKRMADGRADLFARWLVDSTRSNMPYDRFAREILTASGNTRAVAAANYFLAIPTQEERTEMTAQLFMGSRLECARCHNHPFENWTMRDYYSLAAVFARTQVANGNVTQSAAGEALHPASKEVMRPWGMTPEQEQAQAGADRRTFFAEWLTGRGNPLFARVEANRIWADLMGRGIVEPVDDFRSSNPASNAPLLDALAAEFERSGFDRKHLVRLICNSRAYQRSTETNRFNAEDESLFTHARIRLLTAEQLKDAIGAATHAVPPATEVSARSAALQKQLEARKAELGPNAPVPSDAQAQALQSQIDRLEPRLEYATQRRYPERSAFTTAFGQPQRDTACTCERQTSPTLLQALELLNGGSAYRLAAEGAVKYAAMEDGPLVEELYLSALCRRPTAAERETALRYLRRPGKRLETVTDLVWTVVNTQEFLFQH